MATHIEDAIKQTTMYTVELSLLALCKCGMIFDAESFSRFLTEYIETSTQYAGIESAFQDVHEDLKESFNKMGITYD